MNKSRIYFLLILIVLLQGITYAQTSSLVSMGSNGNLIYTPDSRGNVVPDFSAVGFRNGEFPIFPIGVVLTVNPVAGDNLANVQNAINLVAAMPLDSSGYRGTILFTAGIYNLSDTVTISASGIVLRGEGFDGSGTNFIATKPAQHTLFNFLGASGTSYISSSSTRKAITDAYVPIGKKQITVASVHTFARGDKVFVHRIPNDAWINLLGMNLLSNIDPLAVNWTASAYDMNSERKIENINGNVITLDAPIMDIIDPVYSTGELVKFTDNRINNCGIENMRISSTYASSTDENHGWEAVAFDKIYNSWAKNLEVYYFGYSAVHINSNASFITVDACKMYDAKSTIDGGRRYSFNVDGQRCLVQNCITRNGRHDYVNGSRTCGPNVFYNSSSTIQHSDIGPHHRWATGILFDNLVGTGSMDVQNRLDMGSGHGWSGGQIMFWNCIANRMVIQDPPGDEINWAIGCICPDVTGVGDATTEPIGVIQSLGTRIMAIPSLYLAQLNDRLARLVNNQFESNNVGFSMKLSPNPVSSQVTIQANQPFDKNCTVSIVNSNGQVVTKKLDTINFTNDNLELSFEVSNLSSGIYFAEIINNSVPSAIKFIKK